MPHFLYYFFAAIVVPVFVWWMVDFLGTPEPINKLAKFLAVCVGVVLLFIALNGLITGAPLAIG